ncbi:MAG TPA: UDP-glucose 4-epimerase [Citreicella sp.]|nr:UDP-glucose 4-epimerase [Citreicella sp.]
MIHVTGGAGVLGFEILCHLARLGPVTGISRSALPAPVPGAAHRRVADVLAADWLEPGEEAATIVHCAGLSDARARIEGVGDLVTREVLPQTGFAEALLARGWRGHLVYLSSAAVYGDSDDLPIPEPREPQPKGFYALQKLMVENALLFLAAQHGFRLTLLRVANPYGGDLPRRDRGVMRLLMDAADSGAEFTVYGGGTGLRDYLHMSDFLRAVERVCLRPPESGITRLNLGSGTGTALIDLIPRLEAATGRRLSLRHAPSQMEVKSSVLDITRARDLLAWAPRVGLEEGLARMVARWRATAPQA